MVFNVKTASLLAAATVATASVIELPVHIEGSYVDYHLSSYNQLN